MKHWLTDEDRRETFVIVAVLTMWIGSPIVGLLGAKFVFLTAFSAIGLHALLCIPQAWRDRRDIAEVAERTKQRMKELQAEGVLDQNGLIILPLDKEKRHEQSVP